MRKIKLFLFSAFLLLLSGYTQATVKTVTSADGGSTVSGSLYLVARSLSDGDTLTFADNVKNIKLSTDMIMYNNTNNTTTGLYAITVLGKGVTISSISTARKLFCGPSNIAQGFSTNYIVKDVNFKNLNVMVAAKSFTAENCTFKAVGYNNTLTLQAALKNTDYTYLLKGCAFIGKGSNRSVVYPTINTNPNLAITQSSSFVSCTFINENGTNSSGNIFYELAQTQTSYARSTTFTNCVLLDNSYSDASSFYSVKVTGFTSNGYNVIQGSVNGAWSASPSWAKGTDVIRQGMDTPSPLTMQADTAYFVHVGGAAYRHLPANAAVDGVTFPAKDLAGNTINYTKTSHSGAWQSIDGTDTSDEVALTGITIGGASDSTKVFTETTTQLSAGVQPNGVTEQGSTWRSTNVSVATVDATGLVTFLPTTADTATVKRVTIIATSVALSSAGKQLSDSVTFIVKPYVHVASVSIGTYTSTTAAIYSNTTISSLINQSSVYLTTNVLPANANNKAITWSVDDTNIASVTFYNNLWFVKGKTTGTTTLRATAADGSVQGTRTLIFHDNSVYADAGGMFMLTEGNYPGTGRLNYLFPDGSWDYDVYTTFSGGRTFGVTTQYGAIYGDKAYFVSKQGPRLVVTDAAKMTEYREFWNIGSVGSNNIDGRSFLGVDEHKGYVGTSSGICVVNLDSLPIVTGDRVENSKVVDIAVSNLPYTAVTGSGSSDGGLYSQQIGTMIRVGDRVFAVQQGVGLLVINALTNQLETTLKGYNYATLTLSKDGYLWSGTTKYVSTGTLDEESSNVLLRIDPWSLEVKEVALPSGYAGPVSYWGAWQADAVAGSPKENVLYWTGDNNHKIYRYDIATNTIQTFFDAADMALPSDFPSSKWAMYGTSFGIHPVTGELYAWITLFNLSATNPERQIWEVVKIDPQTDDKTVYPMDRQYWWPSMMVFQDKQAPVISNALSSVSLTATQRTAKLYIGDKITDEDNQNAAIIKSVILNEGEGLINAQVWRDSLIVTQLKDLSADAQTSFTLKANSNGKIVTKVITVNLEKSITPVSITTQPANVKLATGNTATFTIIATGDNLEYQWYKNDAAVNGATANTYSIASTTALDAANYYCVVKNDVSSVISDKVSLAVLQPVAITKQPLSVESVIGSPATFSVIATGDDLEYQWYKNDFSINGVISGTYTIASTTAQDAANYYCMVKNDVSSVISDKVLLKINLSTGIETVQQSAITIYPNPVKDYIEVNTDGRIEIFNMIGVLCQRIEKYTVGQKIDISNLSTGNYLVKITSSTSIYINKMIKQ